MEEEKEKENGVTKQYKKQSPDQTNPPLDPYRMKELLGDPQVAARSIVISRTD